MSGKKRLFLIILVSVVVSITIIASSFKLLYHSALEQQKLRLTETVKSQARLIEAVANYDKNAAGTMKLGDFTHNAFEATINQFKSAHSKYNIFGETTEFMLAKKENDKIIYLFYHEHNRFRDDATTPITKTSAAPMNLALDGKSGTMFNINTHGEEVLSAYEPVDIYNLGIVAQTNVSEIKAPFIKSGIIASCIAFLLVLICTYLTYKILNPLIEEVVENKITLKEKKARLEALRSVISVADLNLDTISDHILKTVLKITESNYGFYGFVKENESIMVIHSWSGDAMQDCSMVKKPTQFSVKDSGLLGEAIRIRQPLIINDYSNDHPGKKGLPEGHVPLINLLVVPFETENEITSVVAVANRKLAYSHDDIEQVNVFLSSIQNIVKSKWAEEALKESEEKYRTIIEGALDGVAICDQNGIILEANEAYCKMIGYDKEELVGKAWDEIIVETKNEVKEHFNKLKKNGSDNYDTKHRKKDGSLIHVNINVRRFNQTDETYVNFIHDITDRNSALEALKKSEEQFKTLTESSPTAIYLTDKDGDFVYANHKWLELAGMKFEDAMGGGWINALHPEDRETIGEKWYRSVQSNGKWAYEYRFKTPQGKITYIYGTAAPILDENGKIIGYVGSNLDISDRKQAEKEIKKQQYYLTKAQEIGKIGTWELDLKKNILVWTDENYHIFGVPVGTPLTYEIFLECVHPDDREYVNKEWMAAINGKPYDIEHRLVVDGKIKWVREKAEVKFNKQGKAVYAIGFTQEITKHKETEIALKESDERHRKLFEQSNDAIFVYDLTGQIIEINNRACELLGYGHDELMKLNVLRLVSRSEFKKCQLALYALKETESVYLDTRFLGKNGNKIDVSISAKLVDPDAGLVQGIVRDETETKRLKELESRAERLETAGTIAGQVAHDFNNLLAPLMAYPEFIRDELPNDHPTLAYIDQIEKASVEIAEINQDLLAMGRRGHYNQNILNLNDILQTTLDSLGSTPKSLVFHTELGENLLDVKGGKAQLNRVINNLINNARDAMQDIGTLTIKTENYYVDDVSVIYGRVPKGEYVKLTITDTGCGIPQDILQKIFDPFFTSKTTDKRRGSGLGLSVVDAVIKDHNGFIDLTTKVGEGTSFFIYLPVTRDAMDSKHETNSAGGNEKILVVDDDEIQRVVTVKILEKLGYRVTTVKNGSEAVESVSKNNYDLILLDMVMPGGIDGAETYKRIVEIKPYQKAIILSGFSETERVLEAQKLGAGSFIRKPVTKNIIAQAVRTELDRKKETIET